MSKKTYQFGNPEDHELASIAGLIRAYADGARCNLQDGLFNPEMLEPLLNNIMAQSDRLAALIRQIRGWDVSTQKLQAAIARRDNGDEHWENELA